MSLRNATYSLSTRILSSRRSALIQTYRYLSTDRRHGLRIAVIGAGPAGFYTSYRLMAQLPDVRVDMYESLPVPYGLIRYGVAPDHPEVKVGSHLFAYQSFDKFNEIAEDERFTFIGNTPIGTSWPHRPHRSLPLSSIAHHYDALLLAYGASRDRMLSIPGEQNLEGVYSARAFVGWYNGLPEYRDLQPRLQEESALIIGQGNVALDVARILLSDVDMLRKTDITEYALEALSRSRVKHVRVIGRRGPLQAAFTAKELREMLSLPGVGFHPVSPSFYPEDLATLSRQSKRILQILQKGARTSLSEAKRIWELQFLRSPMEFLPEKTNPHSLGAVKLQKTRLEGGPFATSAKAAGTGDSEVVSAGLAFRSIGYLSEPIPGLNQLGIPFNVKSGLVPNEDGRVVKLDSSVEEHGNTLPGVYTSGWVKRGPTGVIASTMYDAFDTADAIVADWKDGREFMNASDTSQKQGWKAIEEDVKARGIRPVNWREWQRIDIAERERGRQAGKERLKFTSEEDMLAVLNEA